MRDWFFHNQFSLLPAAATLTLHGLLLLLLVVRFHIDGQPRTIEARVLPPAVINAKLIDASSLKPKPRPRAETKPPPRAPAKPAPKPRAAAPKPAVPPPKAVAEPAPKPEPAPRPETRPERISAEELAAISRRELAESLQAEDAAQVAVTAEQMAASYAALIRDTVTSYWSRPPSARNGMQVLLELQLVPTGEIVSVRVLEGSGSVAFDRSALNAVDKAGSFPELKNLPNREFEKTFRRFQLLFRPEDLRY